MLAICIDYQINKEISLPRPEDVGEIGRTSLNLVFLIFSHCSIVLAVGSTSILHLWLKGYSKWLLICAQQVVSEHPKFVVRSSGDSKGIFADWWRSCVDLRSALGLFVGSCVDLKTVCEVLKESI